MNAQMVEWGNPDRPDEYRRRVLLAVTGESPQVVTETLYALAVTGASGFDFAEKELPFRDKKMALAALKKARKTLPYMPTEVLLITTSKGEEKAEILRERIRGLIDYYELENIPAEKIKIRVITDKNGRKIDDIRSISDNEAAADFITQCLRDLTSDPSTAIHASIAGGRKTMGALLASLMAIYGRPQDRLTHVLVSGPIDVEKCPDFYFPHLYEQRLISEVSPDGKKTSKQHFTYKFKVELAKLPLLLFRHFEVEPDELIGPGEGLGKAVQNLRRCLGPITLVLNPAELTLICGEKGKVKLSPEEYAFYAAFAMRARITKVMCRWMTLIYLSSLRNSRV